MKATARIGWRRGLDRRSSPDDSLDYLKTHIEPLEDRKLLVAQVVYVNDNWNLSGSTILMNGSAVVDPTSGITMGYGSTAFGKVTSGVSSDVTGGIFQTITSAINPDSVFSNGTGTVSILDGTYQESDIIVDLNVVVKGFASSGATQTLITPGIASTPTASAGTVAALPAGSHSGFLVYSNNVTISALHIDGSGNGGLGTYQYHQGITTIYQANDGSNTGTYAAQSVTGGPVTNLPTRQLGAATPTISPGPLPNTAVNIVISGNVVENTYLHGITISARQNENFFNSNPGNTSGGPRITNNTVSNIGAFADRDYQRAGIFAQNVAELFLSGNTINNTGTGFAFVPWNDSTHGTFGVGTSGGINGFAVQTTTGNSPFTANTVNDAKTRGYDINFMTAAAATGNVYQNTNTDPLNSLANNTTVGIYTTYNAMLWRGMRIDGAYIGIEIQNTSRVDLNDNPSVRYPTFNGDTLINGPLVGGLPRAGSVGILAQSGNGFSRPANSVAGPTPFEISSSSISRFDTALQIGQPLLHATASEVVIDRIQEAGNNTGLNLGDHATVTGTWKSSAAIVVTGSNSSFQPGYDPPVAFVNSVSPTVTPPFPPTSATTSAPIPNSTVDANSMPGAIGAGNITLGFSSRFNVSLSGLPASTLLDDFNTAVTFSSSPQSGITPWRTNGFKVAGIRSASWNATPNPIIQNGTSGAFKVRPNDPANLIQGAVETLAGYAYHYNSSGVGAGAVVTTVNAAGFDTVEVSLRLPNAIPLGTTNGNLNDGFATINSDTGMRIVRVALIDLDNTSRVWDVQTRILSSTAFTPIRINLGGPQNPNDSTVPFNSSNFFNSDGLFNLQQVAGWSVSVLNTNGNANTPFGIVLDSIRLLRETGIDQLVATGDVALNGGATGAGAMLTGEFNPNVTPTVGAVYRIVDNQGANPVVGRFRDSFGNDLSEGALLGLGTGKFQISYTGGTGNDIVLTALADSAPTIDLDTSTGGNDSQVSYVGLLTHAPVYIAPSATLADADDPLVLGVNVDLNLDVGATNNPTLVTGDHLVVDLPMTIVDDNPGEQEDRYQIIGTNIQSYYNVSTGVLSLSGSDIQANYVNVLRKVQYFNNGPTGPMASVRFGLATVLTNTLSASANVTINIDPTNVIPVVDLNSAGAGVDNTTSYTLTSVVNSTAVVLAPSATITDADPTLFSLTVALNRDVDPDPDVTLNVTGDLLDIAPGTFTSTLFDDHEVDEGDADADNEAASDDEYRIEGGLIPSSITILANYNWTNGELTLQGLASVAVYQQLLRNVRYTYQFGYDDPDLITPANALDHEDITGPMATQRNMVVTAFDGVSFGGEANQFLQIKASNAEPFIDADNTTDGENRYQQIQITGNSPPFAIKNLGDLATLADSDDATLLGLRVYTQFEDGTAVITADTTGTPIQKAYTVAGAGSALTLYGVATVAQYRQVLQTVQWQEPTNPSPNLNGRYFYIAPYDGTSFNQVLSAVLFDPNYFAGDFPGPNPAPYVDLNGTFDANGELNGNNNTVTYMGVPVLLATSVAVLDNPHYEPDIYTLTATLNSFNAGDVLEVPNAVLAGTYITQNYDGAGTLTLSGFDTTERYLEALKQLTYSNTLNAGLPTQKRVTITVSDSIQDNSLAPAVATTNISPIGSFVLARQLFYNNSAFDLNGGVDANDDLAIATNKSAYLPGSGAMTVSPVTFPNDQKSFVHVSSYTRGINGLMIDISGLHPGITVSDFTFKVGSNNSPSLWAAPSAAPTSVTVRTTGVGLAAGNTRVQIIWPNNSIRNTWLEVRVKANANTGLLDAAQLPNGDGIGHIFYYGNRYADSGSGNTVSFVSGATDEILARNNPGNNLPITNRFDYNKDKLVNATDQILKRNNPGVLTLINIANPPAAPPAIELLQESGGGPAVATININILPDAIVLARQLFYNNSAYDLNGGVDANDDLAIATNKSAYFPGGGPMEITGLSFPNNQKSFVHLSSYSRGINGLMIDILGLHPGITASDFTFKVGANNFPSLWAAPSVAPTSVTVRTTGLGLALGNTRVEIIWPNHSIRNTWLEVRVKANANTGLADNAQLPDGDGVGHIFYYGNRVADSGSGNTVSFVTNATDEIIARNNPGSALPLTNRFDYNKDNLVQGTDQITARNFPGILPLLNISNPPAAPPPVANATADEGDASALAAGLAASQVAAGAAPNPIPGWLANRLSLVDLNAGPAVRLFEHLAERDTPRARAVLVAADRMADELDLDHERLEDIVASLGLG